ncbi:MAG: hypothetical protein IPL42_11015 [Saprospiraceae bacterium]|nr:hypothetical protein [Saprospiraceae bacterium]
MMKAQILISIIFCFLYLSCNNETRKETPVSKNENPESFLKKEPKLEHLEVPTEIASLPFCLDSSALPQHKKNFCAHKMLSEQLIKLHPEWNTASGLVNLNLIVETDGSVSDILLKDDFTGLSIGPAVTKACIDFLKAYKCIPGKKNGQQIRSKLEIPVYFGLEALGKDFVQ